MAILKEAEKWSKLPCKLNYVLLVSIIESIDLLGIYVSVYECYHI